MTKKQKTATQKEYEKQRKRIKQFISRAEKRGYQFSSKVLPEVPKRITKASVAKLAKLTPQQLYKKSVYGGEATGGEIVTGTKGLQLERSYRAKKASETRKANKKSESRFWSREDAEQHKSELPKGGETIYQNIFDEFISRLSIDVSEVKRKPSAKYASEQSKTTLINLAKSIANQDGKDTIGWRLQANPEIENLIYYVLYGSRAELIQSATYRIAEIIKGSGLTMQELQDLQDESEMNEDWENPE